jgi:AraC-like DNA-binding protein
MQALIRAASLTNYAEVARRAGLNPTQMLSSVGIPAAALQNPDLRISAALVGALLERSARESKCPTIGLQMAESRRLSDLGVLTLLLTYQPTLRDVIAKCIEYMHLLNETLALTIEDAGDIVIVREEIISTGENPTRQETELAVGVLFRLFRTLLGNNWRPDSVCFAHNGPADLTVHKRLFGLTPTFNSEFNGIVLHVRELDRNNPAADPVMAQYAKQLIEAMPGVSTPSIANEVRKALYLLVPLQRATVEQVASGLGITVRMLQRRLDETGATFSALLTEVRRELATRYLANPEYSITQVGEMLGFTHMSTFSRWYSSQFGSSPARARRDRRPH